MDQTLLSIILVSAAILALAVWIWTVQDLIRSRYFQPRQRIVWGLLLLSFSLLGSILYLAISPGQKLANRNRPTP